MGSGFDALPSWTLDRDQPCAVLADLHANLEALAAVDRWLASEGITQVLVLGDLVGYGASPEAVVALVRERGWRCLRGNHEELLGGTAPASVELKKRALAAIEWSRSRLSPEDAAWLGGLPEIVRLDRAAVAVHGSLVARRHCWAYIYDLSLDLNLRSLQELALPAGSLVLFGHTHRGVLYSTDGEQWQEVPASTQDRELDEAAWTFVNPGSVGYPRDGDPRASLLVWEPARRRVRHVRLAYDVAAAAERIRAAGYAPELAARLLEAR